VTVLLSGCHPGPRTERERWEVCLGAGQARGAPTATGGRAALTPLELGGVPGYSATGCDHGQRLGAGHTLHLFHHPGHDARALAEGLQRYYRRHALTFAAWQREAAIDLPHLLDNDPAELAGALRCAFPELDLGSEDLPPEDMERVEAFSLSFALRPVRAFLAAFRAGDHTTQLVAVERVFRHDDGRSDAPVALAISPRYLAAQPEPELWGSVHLPAGFTPTVFVAAPALAGATGDSDLPMDLTIAHEFAHTTGLAHSWAPENLMRPVLDPLAVSCRWGLRPEQLAVMDQALGTGGLGASVQALAAAGVPSPSGAARRARLRRWLGGDRAALSEVLRGLVETHAP